MFHFTVSHVCASYCHPSHPSLCVTDCLSQAAFQHGSAPLCVLPHALLAVFLSEELHPRQLRRLHRRIADGRRARPTQAELKASFRGTPKATRLTPRGLSAWAVVIGCRAVPPPSISRPLFISPLPTRRVIPTNFSSARPFPLQAEALKREVDALKSVLRSRGPQAQEGANAISLSPNSTMDELQQLGSPAASDGSFLPGCFMTHGQPEGSPSSTRPSGSTPHRQAFPAASQQRPPQVKVGAFARVMSFRRTKPSPRVSPA